MRARHNAKHRVIQPWTVVYLSVWLAKSHRDYSSFATNGFNASNQKRGQIVTIPKGLATGLDLVDHAHRVFDLLDSKRIPRVAKLWAACPIEQGQGFRPIITGSDEPDHIFDS
jgi:hypothetical protein